VVEENTESGPTNRGVDVCVVKDDVGALSTKLEGDVLEVRRSGSLHDVTTNKSRSSECDLFNVHMRGNRGADGVSVASNKVDNTSRQASLLEQRDNPQRAQGRKLAGLDDDSVTRRERRCELPREHQEGEIPGDNLANDTDRLMASVRQPTLVDFCDLAVDLVGPSTVVPEARGSFGRVKCLGDGEGLAVIESLNGRDLVNVALDESGDLDQDFPALYTRDMEAPFGVVRVLGSLDGEVDVLLGTLADLGDDLASGGVDDIDGGLVATVEKLAVDEEASVELGLHGVAIVLKAVLEDGRHDDR